MADHLSQDNFQGDVKRRYVSDLFSRIAPRYDLMNTVMTGGMHHRWRSVAVKAATRDLEGAALDVATGTGDLAFTLARAQGISSVIGLDLLPEMVVRARSKSHHRATGYDIQFMVGDALSLPFPDNTFACITSGWGLRNMPDLRRSLEEMTRVVRPGGRVVALESLPVQGGLFQYPFRLFF
ncbi:MAG: class I SAM-dependent methyltransferase, partial [Dehalococcoidia bacterium]|nr:class I SAM-dependent methyltransferase [Dehalococcoidia bacterium]